MKNDHEAAGALQASRDRLANDITEVAHEAGDVFKDLAARKLQDAGGVLQDAKGAVAGGARDLAGAANQYVHQHPWQAMGAAAVVGMVLVLLARRR